MKLKLYKYHGAGNDFVIIDNRQSKLSLDKDIISLICKRRFGIGADGFMLLNDSQNYDFSMRYYNSDGGEANMCGNGGRCIVAFAHKLGIIDTETTFEAIDGIHKAKINSVEKHIFDISLKMIDVVNIQDNGDSYFLDTGVPHHIIFSKNIGEIDINKKGREIRYSEYYKNIGGTNVNFVEETKNGLKIRTYERGVEGETLACGTGATAAAIAHAIKNNIYNKTINLQAKGGELRLQFDKIDNNFTNIILSGPAELVFYAEMELSI